MKRMKKAFTLIEILIVVVLLGILAAIVIPQFSDASDQAKISAQASDLHTLRGQIQLYRAKTGGYPATLAALSPTYIETIPNDPVSGSAYAYLPGTGAVSAPAAP